MARKPWEDLSPKYRARLERKGITRAKHESGTPLHKARGKVSKTHESRQRRINKFIKEYESTYSFVPKDDYRQIIRDLSPRQRDRYIAVQQRMQHAYESGDYIKSTDLYTHRDKSLPDYAYYYHGVFS
jgi:hypothetical protein